MNMSSSTLVLIQKNLAIHGNSVLLIMGNIGNFFIIILFSQHHRNPCTMYLISSTVMNNLYLIFQALFQLFPVTYNAEMTSAFISCKFHAYFIHVFGQIGKTMMALACIDRFLITSNHVRMRAFSTTKRAKYLIMFSFIFWFIFACHIPIMATVTNQKCTFSSTYLIFFAAYTIIVVGLLPPIILGLFGYLTFRNIKQRYVRVQPVVQLRNNTNISLQRRDRDLLILVISEVFVYVITTIPYSLMLSEANISMYILTNKSIQYAQIESFIQTITTFVLLANSAASFYIYLISSKSFRRDFKQLILNCYQKLIGKQPDQIVHRTKQRLPIQQTPV